MNNNNIPASRFRERTNPSTIIINCNSSMSSFMSDSDHSGNSSSSAFSFDSSESVATSKDNDVEFIFSSLKFDYNVVDSPLLTKEPTRKARKPIDKSPSFYLPLNNIEGIVNGDNAKNVLKQR